VATSRAAVLFANTTVRGPRTSEATKKAPFPASGRRREDVSARRTHFFTPARPQKSLDTLQQQTNCLFILPLLRPFVNFQGQNPKAARAFQPFSRLIGQTEYLL